MTDIDSTYTDAHDTEAAASLTEHVVATYCGGWSTLAAVERWAGQHNRPLPEGFTMLLW